MKEGFSFFPAGVLLNDLSVREYAHVRNADYIRVSSILVENDSLLVVRQVLEEQSFWNIPGGKLELGETMAQCAVREVYEETGFHVCPVKPLYLTDRKRRLGNSVVDVTYLVARSQGHKFECRDLADSQECIEDVSFIPTFDLCSYGLGSRLGWLIQKGFPESGSYVGEFHKFYGCES